MFRTKKYYRQMVENAYNNGKDANLVSTRKTVFANISGKEVLLYRKAMISKVEIGSDSIVKGFFVTDTVKTEGKDGIVIAESLHS